MKDLAQLLVAGLATGCVYGLVALGFVLIYKASEVINFAQGDVLMVGTFLALTCITTLGMGFWAGSIAAILVMVVLGWLLDAFVVRRVIGQPQFSIVMLTIGIGMVLRCAASIIWGPTPRTLNSPFNQGQWSISGVSISEVYVSIIAGTFLICALLFGFLRYTRVGIAMQAASQNQIAAYVMGVPVKRILSGIWGLAAAVSTMAGLLVAPLSLVDPNMGSIALRSLAAAVLGGFSSVVGALVGGAIVGIAQLLASAYVEESLRDVVPHAIVLLVLVFRPQGLFGGVARKKV